MSSADFLATRERVADRMTVRLSRGEAFVQTFDGRSASTGDLRRIVSNEAARLSPGPDKDLVILAGRAPEGSGEVMLVHIRATDVDMLEAHPETLGIAALSLSPEDTLDLSFPSPATLDQARRERRLWTIALLALISSLTLALAGLGHSLSEAASLAGAREAMLRAELLQRREAERETGALAALSFLRPEARTPPARLEMLARLNDHTPQSAWWTGIDMTGTQIRLTGLGDNAADVLTSLTAAFPGHSVQLEETAADAASGRQRFVIFIAEPDI